METHVEFRSDRFPPLEGEEELINPDLWGKRLADFLREGLRKHGFETKEPIAEDWGWVVPVVNESFRLWIGCGHYQEYQDGYLCFIEPHKPYVWKWLKRLDTRGRVSALRNPMDRVLGAEEGIRFKRWWTYEGFNGQCVESPSVVCRKATISVQHNKERYSPRRPTCIAYDSL